MQTLTKIFTQLTLCTFALLMSACSDEKKIVKSSAPGMKCGSGKCGANMFDGNAALVKKKKNILAQMRKNDPRENCVKSAKSTKKMYDCVRDPKTHIMTIKCAAAVKSQKSVMKCGAGKCGASQ